MSVYEFDDYRAYLTAMAGGENKRTGVRAAMAKAMHCQPAYVSRVFKGLADINLEQAERLNRYFAHTKDEGKYFLLIVQLARAGTKDLRDFFLQELNEFKHKRMSVEERLGRPENLTKENQSVYYSSWHYAAIHMALSIPQYQTEEALSAHFQMPLKKARQVLEFLVNVGLANIKEGRYTIGQTHIHLSNSSEHIYRHHANWRSKAIASLDRESAEDLHYSAAVSLAKKDKERVKEVLLEALNRSIKEIEKSENEDDVCCLGIDFFSI